MRVIALDTETDLIARGRQVPPMACLTWAELDLRPGPTTGQIFKSGIVHHSNALAFLLPLLGDPDVTLVGASTAFDVLVTSAMWPNPDPDSPSYIEEVLAAWVLAYDHDRVTDVLVRQKLLDLAAGCYRRQQVSDGRWIHHKYNLAGVTKRLTGIVLDKGDAKKAKRADTSLTLAEQAARAEDAEEGEEAEDHWRLRYAELRDKPVEEWPHEAVKYAVRDAEATVLCWWAQQPPGWRRRMAGQVGTRGLGPGAGLVPGPTQAPARASVPPPGRPAGLPGVRPAGVPPGGLPSGWSMKAGTKAPAVSSGASCNIWCSPLRSFTPAIHTPGSTFIPISEQRVTNAPDWLWARVYENFGEHADPFIDEHRQARGALWLRAMSAHGLRTDPEAVERFAERVQRKHTEVTSRLVAEGLVRVEYHLNADALKSLVAELGGAGTKKAQLIELASRLTAEGDARSAPIQEAAGWLSLIKILRNPEASADAQAVAADRFALLERAGLAFRTFHRDTKAAARRMHEACEAAGIPTPRTESYDPTRHGAFECVALDRDACNSIDDATLQDYSELSHLAKMIAADLPVLRSGATAPIHTHFEELLETGRTGSSKPNVQNRARGEKCHACHGDALLRKTCQPCMGTGAELGDRECFVPRPGNVIVDSDYSLGELHTLSQHCLWTLGFSKMAEVLKAGRDPHTAIACTILGVSYEEGAKLKKVKDPVFDNARNASKAVNFGKPGGLGVKTMRAYAVKSYGVDKPEDEWLKILQDWDATWTEMPAFFEWINALPKRKGEATIQRGNVAKVQQLYSLVQPWSGRLRAGATYCSACNSTYQGLLSDVAKRAGWYLFKACYLSPAILHSSAEKYAPSDAVKRASVGQERVTRWRDFRGEFTRATQLEIARCAESLHGAGARPGNFIHDQFLVEVAEAQGDSAARAVGSLMNLAGAEILPDVPVKCEPILARRWSKRAEEVKASGVLVPWEDPRFVRTSA